MKPVAISDRSQEIEVENATTREVHLLYFLIILSRRRKFIILATLLATLLAVGVVLVIPVQYTADTTVLPPGQNSSMSSSLMGQLGGSGALASVAGANLGIKNPSEMYLALFHSRTVEDALIRRFGLMARYHAKKESGARVALESHSKIVLGAKDGLINIAVTDHDPKQAADLANAYVDEFRRLSANLAITEASQRRNFFEQQLLDAKENLTKAEEAMKAMQQATGILQIDSQSRSLIESAAALRAQVVAKEVQIQAMRTYATENNPQIIMDEQQLAALKAQLAMLAGTEQGSRGDFIVPKGKVPGAGMEYIRKVRDVKYYETVSELIAKQFEMAKLDEARQGAIIQVVDVATPPDTRSSPKRTIIVAAVMLFTFVATCLWSVFSERFRRAKDSATNREYLATLRATFR